MPSHLTDIGFPVETEEEFYAAFDQAVERGQPVETGAGTYLCWSAGRGPELWAQIGPQGDGVGLNPHFEGSARMRVALVARIERADGSEMDGAFYAWADPVETEPDDDGNVALDDRFRGAYPFVFDVPDRGRYDGLELPLVVEAQIAAFAHGLRAFANDEEYEASQTDDPHFAPELFIPTGLFDMSHMGEDDYTRSGAADPARSPEALDGDDRADATNEEDEAELEDEDLEALVTNETPTAEAILAGHVLQTAMLINPATGQPFVWARVQTLGGEVDVVADPETVEGDVLPGGVIHGEFWLSGRLYMDHAA